MRRTAELPRAVGRAACRAVYNVCGGEMDRCASPRGNEARDAAAVVAFVGGDAGAAETGPNLAAGDDDGDYDCARTAHARTCAALRAELVAALEPPGASKPTATVARARRGIA